MTIFLRSVFKPKCSLILMIHGSQKIICMNSTFGTTKYGFQFFNIIVPDAFNLDYPVAQFITNKIDKHVLRTNFPSLNGRHIKLNINGNAIMADDKISGPVF